MKILLINFFIIFIIFINPSFQEKAQAISIGVSNPVVKTIIEKGGKKELKYYVSTDNWTQENDFTLKIEEDNSNILDLYNGEKFTIPAGENGYYYSLYIDASNIKLGDYTAKIVFLYNPPTKTGNDSNGTDVKFGVNAEIELKVVEELPEKIKKINVNDLDIFPENINLLNINLDKNNYLVNGFVSGDFEIENHETFIANAIPYSVELYKNNDLVYYFSRKVNSLDVEEKKKIQFSFLARYEPGEYELFVKMGDKSKKTVLYIEQESLLLYKILFLVMLVLSVFFIHKSGHLKKLFFRKR